MREKRPLYRKVNTKARGVHHNSGGDYRHTRNTKTNKDDQPRKSMGGDKKRGLDYTPLFMFLLSKVGQDWDGVFKEAFSRLDRPDPIYWLVTKDLDNGSDFIRCGESSFYSKMYIDGDGKLQLVNPKLNISDLTHVTEFTGGTITLNGRKP